MMTRESGHHWIAPDAAPLQALVVLRAYVTSYGRYVESRQIETVVGSWSRDKAAAVRWLVGA